MWPEKLQQPLQQQVLMVAQHNTATVASKIARKSKEFNVLQCNSCVQQIDARRVLRCMQGPIRALLQQRNNATTRYKGFGQMENRRLKRFAIGDRVMTPTGMIGKVINVNSTGRVAVRYDRAPVWQPTAARGMPSSWGALEVTLKPELLVLL